MNPLCAAYRQPVIWKKNQSWHSHRWSFPCPSCGVAYTRGDPLERRQDGCFDYRIILPRDSAWCERFKRAWKDPQLKWKDLCTIFQLNKCAVEMHAARLDLPDMPKRTIRFLRDKVTRLPNERRLDLRSERRAALLRLMTQTDRRKGEAKGEKYLKAWLRRYDWSWYQKHGRRPHSPPPRSTQYNWEAIDREWLAAAKRILPPIVDEHKRTSPHKVAFMTLQHILEKRLRARFPSPAPERIPSTVAFIQALTENRLEALQRRVNIAVAHFDKQQRFPGFWEFSQRCSLSRRRNIEPLEVECVRVGYKELLDRLNAIPGSYVRCRLFRSTQRLLQQPTPASAKKAVDF